MRFEFVTGDQWLVQVLEISDFNRKIVYELVSAEPAVNYHGHLTTITVFRETLDDRSFVVWETDFSNDATSENILDAKWKKIDAFKSIRKFFSN